MEWYYKPGGLLSSLPQTNWHIWFAWFPVRLTDGKEKNKLVWLEYIERKIEVWTYDDDYFYRSVSRERSNK